MLYEFSCKNFKSIKDLVKFSMLASSDDRYEEYLVTTQKERFSRVSAIYGANGSGKSTFINALGYMAGLVIHTMSIQPGDIIKPINHKLSPEGTSVFTIQFEKNSIRYAYGFSMAKGKFIDEYLYYFPNNKKTKIFERTEMSVTVGSQFRSSFTLAKKAIKENRLFLSIAANYSECMETLQAFLFFKEDLVFFKSENLDNWRTYSFREYKEHQDIHDRTINFLKKLDTGIVDIAITEKENGIQNTNIIVDSGIVASVNNDDSLQATMDYNLFDVDFSDESNGIRKLISIIGPMIDIIDSDRILIFDEIESGLHETIAQALIELFLHQKGNRRPQLIFTTHDTSLLDANLFRRDQIWFTEMKKDNRSTHLYSLAELKNVRKIENYKNGYIMGKYGAVPVIKTDFGDVFNY